MQHQSNRSGARIAASLVLAALIAARASVGWAQPLDGSAIPATGPIPEAAGSTIGYPNTAAALKALRAKPGVEFSEQGGWTIANDKPENTVWSFAPADHPAYPTAVKRQITEKDGSISLAMAVQCEASKAACDDLVRAFQQLNAEIASGARR